MKIYIELLIILALFGVWFLWMMWDTFTKRRAIKKYNPDNDKSRKGEHECRAIDRTEPRVAEKVRNPIGFREPEGREDIPKVYVGSPGKNRSGIRRLLKRRRRR